MEGIIQGSVTVSTAGTRVRLYTPTDDNPTSYVRYIKFKAPSTNTGLIALGTVTVTMATGYELAAGQTLELTECGLQNLYIDAATNGDKIAWIAWSTEAD